MPIVLSLSYPCPILSYLVLSLSLSLSCHKQIFSEFFVPPPCMCAPSKYVHARTGDSVTMYIRTMHTSPGSFLPSALSILFARVGLLPDRCSSGTVRDHDGSLRPQLQRRNFGARRASMHHGVHFLDSLVRRYKM